MKRILIIEDDADIVLSLKYNLEREGRYAVSTSLDGESGLRAARENPPDLILLDLNLPGLDGIEVCRMLRAEGRTASVPIIMVTARIDESERVSGLDSGADDYISKPFSVREVLARIRAVLRRTGGDAGEEAGVLRDDPLLIDPSSRKIFVAGEEVSLTRKEFDLLVYLVRSKGRVMSRERLLERVWGYRDPGETRTVDVHIRKLRMKLGPEVQPRIETVVGVGYRYQGDE
jgi:DNA-binding response OmpR family regulator